MLERLMEQAPALHAAFMEPSVKKAIDIKMLADEGSMRVATLACIHFHSDFFHNAYGYFLS
jgi:hypothetical protein